MDWTLYPNFTEKEFTCSHTGLCHMVPEFMSELQLLRNYFAKPMVITSGYRHGTHPVEIKKSTPGIHCYGVAADILIQGSEAYDLLQLAFSMGRFQGIGIQQKGDGRFIHLDMRQILPIKFPHPAIWSY